MQQEAQQEKEEREKRKADGERSRGTTTVTEAAAATGVTGTVVSSAPSDLSGLLDEDGKTVVASESAVKQQFRVHAKRTVRQYLKPIPMANSEAVMKNAVADNSVGKMVCDGINDCFAIYYTTACAGESLTAPHVRPPPVRGKEHLHKCVSVVTQARSTDDGQLLDGDIYFFVDSGRHSEVTFVNAYGPVDTRPKLTKTPLFMTLTQNSIQKRRELSRGFGQIDQVQNILLITNNPLRIPEVDRLNVANSTNRGNLVGPYSLPDWSSDDVWKVSIAKKKLMYTDKHKVAVGGPTKGAGSDSAGTADCGPPLTFNVPDAGAGRGGGKKKDGNALQPFTFHGLPPEFVSETIHSYSIKGGINCTGSDGTVEKIFIEKKLPILSFCFSEAHVLGLLEMLDEWVFNKFFDEESSLFQAELVEAIKNEGKEANGATPKPRAKPKPKHKATPGDDDEVAKAAQAKKKLIALEKQKKNRDAAKAEGEDDEQEDQEEEEEDDGEEDGVDDDN